MLMVWDRVQEYGSLWLIDLYGPSISKQIHPWGHHIIIWQVVIQATIEYVSRPFHDP